MHTPRNEKPILDLASLPGDARITGTQICNLLEISRTTFWRRIGDGTLPKGHKIGGCLRYKVGDVRAALARLEA